MDFGHSAPSPSKLQKDPTNFDSLLMLRLLPNKIIAHDAVASPLFRLFFCRLLFFIPLYKKEDPKFLINQLFFFFSLAMEFATNLETKTENNA